MSTIKKSSALIPSQILINDYPQLREIGWHIRDGGEITAEEAVNLYKRNRRYLRPEEMTPHEAELFCALAEADENMCSSPVVRNHNQLISTTLQTLNGDLLNEHNFFLGGGTAHAFRYNEYRASRGIDFLVSDKSSYRDLRGLLTERNGFEALCKVPGQIRQVGQVSADQYGVRGKISIPDNKSGHTIIKIEVVLEERIELEASEKTNNICGITSLTDLDMAAEKLLANSDRWLDASVFSRDLIDLAMMSPDKVLLKKAIEKAEEVYGKSVCRDLDKSIRHVLDRPEWLSKCMSVMDMKMPKAMLIDNILNLSRNADLKKIMGVAWP